jgi:hypothetical protein
MRTPSNLLSLAAAGVGCLAVLATPALAQDELSIRRVGPRHDVVRSAAGVSEVDGELHGFGPAYKAVFRDGLVFTPALGDLVEHNQDLAFRLASIRRGGRTLLEAPAAVSPVRTGDRVQFERLGGVVERYDVRADGVELSFVFATRPEGEGDLVVRGDVTTALPRTARDDGTLEFALPGIGGVTIGAVTGVDARGETVRGGLRLDAGGLELSLPASFVDAAVYPIVLDPLIGTQFQIGVNDDTQADVGFQHFLGLYVVAWKRRFSAFDHDVYAQFVTPAGAPSGSPIVVDSAVDVCSRPRVGTVFVVSRVAIVYEKGPGPFGPWSVVARLIVPGGVSSSVTTIAGPGAFGHAVSSEVTNLDDDLLVAYETDAAIEARELTMPPAGTPAVSLPIVISPSPLSNEVALSRTGGPPGQTMLVFSVATANDRELIATVIDRNLNVLAPTGVAFTNNSRNDGHPAVDGDGFTFVVAYQQEEAGSPALHDILGARLNFTGSSIFRAALDVPIEADQGQDERTPDTAWLGPMHCIVFQEAVNATDTAIGAWLVKDTCERCNAKVVLTGLNATSAHTREQQPRIGGRWPFLADGVSDDGIIAFTEARVTQPFTGSVVCQRVEALGPGSAPVNAGGGCGNGGTAFTGGGSPFVIGSPFSRFYVSGLEPQAVPFLSLGFPGAPIGCGPCALTNPISFEFKPNVGGGADSPFPIPCFPGLAGIVLEFQWVSFLTSQSPCPVAAGLSASSRMQVTIGP